MTDQLTSRRVVRDVQSALTNLAQRTPDHFEREQRPFFERVRASYLSLAAEHSERIKLIDAALPLEQVQQQIAAQVQALVGRLRPSS